MFEQAQSSIYNKWPTAEEPDNRYKYSGVELNFGHDKTLIERKTYDSLEWLSDVGGFFDALVLIGRFLVGPITAFAF